MLTHKGVLVLHYYKSIVDGVMTSMIDMFFNLSRSHETRMVFICPELYLLEYDDYYNFSFDQIQYHEYIEGIETIPYEGDHEGEEFEYKRDNNLITTSIPFLRFNRNFGHFNFAFGIDQENNKFKADVIVCSARLIYEILMGADVELECEILYVIDSLDTYKSKIGIFPDFDDLFDTMFKNSNVTQLSNLSNFKETKYRQVEFYHKFSRERMKALKQCNIIKNHYIFNRTKKKKTELEDGKHFENIGKGIFEHLWMGKKVFYSNEGMLCRDGVCFYLDMFHIDGTKNQILTIPKHEIEGKLFWRKKDEEIVQYS